MEPRVRRIQLIFNADAETPEDLITVKSIHRIQLNLFPNNLQFREFLELCTQPKSNEEKHSILVEFENKLISVSEKDGFCEFDVLCLYVLYYIYEKNSDSLSSVSRSLYVWEKLDDLMSHRHGDRNSMIELDNDNFLAELRQFTDINSNSEGLKVVVFAQYESIMGGNEALLRFLLKYGLFEFECNENSVQVLSCVWKKFKGNPDVNISIELEELAFRISRSKLSFRRSVLTFYTIVLIAEYKMYETVATNTGVDSFKHLISMCIPKLSCLDRLLSATTETKITLKDLKYFIAKIFNPFPNRDFICNLSETFRKMSCEINANYNPRRLKDLARCKIRACLKGSQMLPEQVKKLEIADPLKEFLLFHCTEMWDLLEQNHLNMNVIYE